MGIRLRFADVAAGLRLSGAPSGAAFGRASRVVRLFACASGIAEKPGLVLGLDRGGSCRGIAFKISEAKYEATVAYLREREQVTSVYREAIRPVLLVDRPADHIQALCYLVDRSHAQYAGALSRERQLEFVLQGEGHSGANPDYVLATVKELETLGIRDATLEWLAARLKSATAHN